MRWFGHVQRRRKTALARKCFSTQVDGLSRKKGRPKRTWIIVRIDLKKRNLSEDLAQDRLE